jgi:pimeloyl-ACP methyl ester carboxylesterase
MRHTALFTAAALLMLGVLGAPALAQTSPGPAIPPAIYADPPVDPAFPATGLGVQIDSHGALMNGMFYSAAGKGPHPVVVLVHGLPGNEQNLDLARVLQRAGWSVIAYHYRGSWGSSGAFTVENSVEDADAVLAHLRKPEVAKAWRIDPTRMVVIGHSLGGYVAAHAGGANADVIGTALIAPWDPSVDYPMVAKLNETQRAAVAKANFNDIDGRLGAATGVEFVKRLAEHGADWSLAANANGLSTRPLFVAIASHDSPDCKGINLRPALAKTAIKDLTLVEMDTDHGFEDHRIALELAVLHWISRLPGAPQL